MASCDVNAGHVTEGARWSRALHLLSRRLWRRAKKANAHPVEMTMAAAALVCHSILEEGLE
jgi:hypothetical protein